MGTFKEYDGPIVKKWKSKDVLAEFIESNKDSVELNLESLLHTSDQEIIEKSKSSVYSAIRQYAARHNIPADVRMVDGKVVMYRVRETS